MNLVFLSYSHHDSKVAEWLQGKLERFILPKSAVNPVDATCRYLRPVFRDRTDLSTGVLSEVIDSNLEKSMFLIVLCSPHSAQSIWVSKEVQYFFEHGRMDYVIPVIIDGEPYSGNEQECMPQYMREYVQAHPGKEMLCIDLKADGEKLAFLHIVSCILEMPFDVFRARYRRRRSRIIGSQLAGIAVAIVLGLYFLVPIRPQIQLVDEGTDLPHQEGVLTFDGQSIAISEYDTVIDLPSVPGYKRGQHLDIQFSASFYDTICSALHLGFGTHASTQLILSRDDSFSVFAGHVLDEDCNPLSGVVVSIDDRLATTNDDGYFHLSLPVECQAEMQALRIKKEGYQEVTREDECPGTSLTYIMRAIEK